MTMGDLFQWGKALWLVPISLLVFGAAFGLVPGLLLRGIVLLYPKDDSRRQELFGELYAPDMGRFERYVWVFQQLETALRDGVPARQDIRRKRKEARKLHQQLPTLQEQLPTLVDESHIDGQLTNWVSVGNLTEPPRHNVDATAQRAVPPGARDSTDATLMAAVRLGDTTAFEVLYRRHLHAAMRAASCLAHTSVEQEDLLADAFTRVLRALRDGGGPREEFRAYLLVTMRNAAISASRAATMSLDADVPETYLLHPSSDPVVDRWDAMTAATAFASLPERWRTVLWHTEVEDESPAEIAPLLGMRPNGVAALAYRAREGLRQAYLLAHLPEVEHAECRATVSRLAGWVRQSVPVPLSHKISRHLASCSDCRARANALTKLNEELR